MKKHTYADRCATDPLYKQKRSMYLSMYRKTIRGKEVQRKADAKRRRVHPEEVKKKTRDSVSKWRKAHPETNKIRVRCSHLKAKERVLAHYGKNGIPQCCWKSCFITDLDMLTLDHINNDGAVRRRRGEPKGHELYWWLKRMGFPKGFQTLCWNHQWKKRIQHLQESV